MSGVSNESIQPAVNRPPLRIQIEEVEAWTLNDRRHPRRGAAESLEPQIIGLYGCIGLPAAAPSFICVGRMAIDSQRGNCT